MVDRELRFVHVNRMLTEMNGLDAQAHIGRTVREIVLDVADLLAALHPLCHPRGDAGSRNRRHPRWPDPLPEGIPSAIQDGSWHGETTIA